MNSTSILEQFVVKGKDTQLKGWVLSTMIVIITAIVVAAIALFAGAVPVNTVVGETSSIDFVQSPELMVAKRYAADVAARGETLFEITNPELNLVMRYEQALAEAEISQYPNPELMVVERSAPDWVENPELNLAGYASESSEVDAVVPKAQLMAAERFASGPASGLTIEQKYAVMGIEAEEPASFYANPELNLVGRFAGASEAVTGLTTEQKYAVMGIEAAEPASFYANPELNLVGRLSGGSEAVTGLTIKQKYAVMGIETAEPASFYANPELNLVGRLSGGSEAVTGLTIEQKYAVMGVEVEQAFSFHENPEVFLAQKFSLGGEPVSQYPNPELALAQRLTIERGEGSTQWVENPEVLLAQKFAPAADSAFLSANPEIKVHLQFINGG